jgi:Tat protein secretion system quality control protein TatD with DNase activity
LIETEAPDTLKDLVSHTDFLQAGYQRVAELRGLAVEALAEQVAANFNCYFLND